MARWDGIARTCVTRWDSTARTCVARWDGRARTCVARWDNTARTCVARWNGIHVMTIKRLLSTNLSHYSFIIIIIIIIIVFIRKVKRNTLHVYNYMTAMRPSSKSEPAKI